MIELILANYMLLLNIYLIGFLVYLTFEVIGRGVVEVDMDGVFRESLKWPLHVFYMIGTLITYMRYRKDTKTPKGKK